MNFCILTTNNKKETTKTIPFIRASKKNKILGNTLIQGRGTLAY